MNNTNETIKNIKGWGVDATNGISARADIDPETGKSMDAKADLIHQKAHKEVLHSNERPNMTAVFGTTLPPSGLSGSLRRFAFRYSESNWMHWLSLLIADRVNVAEGLISDVRNGHFPNIPKEKGWNAKWKYDRRKTIGNIAVGAGILLLAVLYARKKRK